MLILADQVALAAPTSVALVTSAPDAKGLVDCISRRLVAAGPVVDAEHMVEGLEFRISLRRALDESSVIAVTGLLKPDMGTLMQSHDNDPEAQPAAAARFYGLLRIHIGTRGWVWHRERESTICNQAAGWIESLRSRPVLLDRLGPDGEAR